MKLDSIIKQVTGLLKIKGDTDGTKIGNVADALKTSTAVTSSVLPSGAATAAKQDTGNASVGSLDTKVPSGLAMTGDRLKVDATLTTTSSSAAITIDSAHAKVHEGKYFTHSSLHLSVGSNANVDHLIVVGANAVHASFALAGFGDAYFYLYEGTVTSINGTPAPSFNNNRSSANVPTVNLYDAPTITTIGTQLAATLLIGGAGGNAVGGKDGGPVRTGGEIILAANTKYLFRFTNKSGQTRDFSLSIGWYE
jgi:hypothetical protein